MQLSEVIALFSSGKISLKPKISIYHIGKFRFFLGVAMGLITAVATTLFFNYSREIGRYAVSTSHDLVRISHFNYLAYGLFFTSLSVALGFSITVHIWMSGRRWPGRRRELLHKRLAYSNANLFFWVMLLVVFRYASIFLIVLYVAPHYNRFYYLLDVLWPVMVLIPLVLFWQSAMVVQIIYCCSRWLIYAFITCILLTFSLQFTALDSGYVDSLYNRQHIEEYGYLEKVINTGKKKYNLQFSEKEIVALRELESPRSQDQVKAVKMSFRSSGPVSLDAILLEKVIVHNAKYYFSDSQYGAAFLVWQYALPNEIYRQIKIQRQDTIATRELVELMNQEAELWNASILDSLEDFDETEFSWHARRYTRSKSAATPEFFQQFVSVRDSLLADSSSSNHPNLTPVLPHKKYLSKRYRMMEGLYAHH